MILEIKKKSQIFGKILNFWIDFPKSIIKVNIKSFMLHKIKNLKKYLKKTISCHGDGIHIITSVKTNRKL